MKIRKTVYSVFFAAALTAGCSQSDDQQTALSPEPSYVTEISADADRTSSEDTEAQEETEKQDVTEPSDDTEDREETKKPEETGQPDETEVRNETGEGQETTEPPVTEPPVTEPPMTEPPATEPPATEPPATESPVVEPTVGNILADPDNVIDLSTSLYTYDRMAADLNLLAAAYPDRMALESLGTTADGRDIYVVYFGNRSAERQIFICAATHAREYMTTQLVMKQLEYYSAHYDTDAYNGQTYREIFTRTCFVIVPMVNPDGVSISQLGEAGIRNEALRAGLRSIYESDVANGYTGDDYGYYLTRWKANARGVDLNRNYSPGWNLVADRSAPSSTFYKGEVPGSEVESQALMNVINSLSNPRMAISYHSYGDLVYWQYGQPEPMWSANQQLAAAISNLTGHYLAGYSNEAGFSNWCVWEKGIPSVTVETGTVPAPLPIEQFSLLWSQHQYTWVMLGTYE